VYRIGELPYLDTGQDLLPYVVQSAEGGVLKSYSRCKGVSHFAVCGGYGPVQIKAGTNIVRMRDAVGWVEK